MRPFVGLLKGTRMGFGRSVAATGLEKALLGLEGFAQCLAFDLCFSFMTWCFGCWSLLRGLSLGLLLDLRPLNSWWPIRIHIAKELWVWCSEAGSSHFAWWFNSWSSFGRIVPTLFLIIHFAFHF